MALGVVKMIGSDIYGRISHSFILEKWFCTAVCAGQFLAHADTH